MATNFDFGRSSLIRDQYLRDMDLISAALQEESQDEREERLGLVLQSWPMTCACFQSQRESNDAPVHVPVAYAHP